MFLANQEWSVILEYYVKRYMPTSNREWESVTISNFLLLISNLNSYLTDWSDHEFLMWQEDGPHRMVRFFSWGEDEDESEVVEAFFREFDLDGDGIITASELSEALKNISPEDDGIGLRALQKLFADDPSLRMDIKCFKELLQKFRVFMARGYVGSSSCDLKLHWPVTCVWEP
jgi:hypothetical protein